MAYLFNNDGTKENNGNEECLAFSLLQVAYRLDRLMVLALKVPQLK
jgi:hypothetical protein